MYHGDITYLFSLYYFKCAPAAKIPFFFWHLFRAILPGPALPCIAKIPYRVKHMPLINSKTSHPAFSEYRQHCGTLSYLLPFVRLQLPTLCLILRTEPTKAVFSVHIANLVFFETQHLLPISASRLHTPFLPGI